jgi:hypothetical protein
MWVALLLYQNGDCSLVMEYVEYVPYPVIFRSPGKRVALLLYQSRGCSLVIEFTNDVPYPVIFCSPGKRVALLLNQNGGCSLITECAGDALHIYRHLSHREKTDGNQDLYKNIILQREPQWYSEVMQIL